MLRQPSVSVSAHRQSLLAERAHAMRSQLTPSEAVLWQAIRGKRLGVAFRRQVVIGGSFIADFAAVREKLIVEVDGGYHALRCSADTDRARHVRTFVDQSRFARGLGEPSEPIVTGYTTADAVVVQPHALET